MGKSQQRREEIEEKYTWDLSYIYKKDSDWQNDFNKVSKEIASLLAGSNANLENFGQGMADLHDDTDATATLIPNNYDNQASAMYNIYCLL